MTHPFLHSGRPISCSHWRMYCTFTHQHTQTHTKHNNTDKHETFLHFYTSSLRMFYIFTTLLHLCTQFSPYPPCRKPHRMKSMRGGGMIGQWEANCHWNYVPTIQANTHTQGVERGKRGTEKWGVLVLRHPVFTLSHCIFIIEERERCTDRFYLWWRS